MNSNTFYQAQESSSPNLTVRSVRSEQLLQLGKKIVHELGAGQQNDTLGHWMAHYIAELIAAAEMASEEQRGVKLKECADAILDFWKHRSELPNGKRPFEDFEPILKALEALSPSEHRWRYYPTQVLEADVAEESAATQKWLEAAKTLDQSARALVRYCLVRAAESALTKSREWVGLAEAAEVAEGGDFLVIRSIMEDSDLLNTVDPTAIERKLIEDRIKQLEAFTCMAKELLADLCKQLEKVGTPNDGR